MRLVALSDQVASDDRLKGWFDDLEYRGWRGGCTVVWASVTLRSNV